MCIRDRPYSMLHPSARARDFPKTSAGKPKHRPVPASSATAAAGLTCHCGAPETTPIPRRPTPDSP
eukprot:4216918-Alexandrium_andersonii.AAC.1